MQNLTHRRPQPHEYGSFYKSYIDRIPTEDFFGALMKSKKELIELLKGLPAEKWDYRYAEGKWSVKEMIQHMIDGERVFSYRALRFARKDATPLPGFDENDFAEASHAHLRTAESLIAEYEVVRDATLHLYRHFTEEDLNRAGQMSGYPASVLAIGFIIAGHEQHHISVLKERYLD